MNRLRNIPGSTPGRRRAATIAIGVVLVALVAGILATGRPGGSPAGASTNPGASQAAGSSAKSTTAPGPTGSEPPEDAWSAAVLPPLAAVADLRADRADSTGIRLDTAFTLASLAGADPRSLAARLETDPALSLSVAAGPTPTTVSLRPAQALVAGSTYRFTLRAEDGTVAGSWAFQSRAPLHVVNTLPGDATTNVPIDTGIEVTFDQDGAGDIANSFSISPKVNGRFERNGRTQVFVPSGLRRATLYTVTIRHGLPIQGSDLTLEKDVRFRFETADSTASRSVRFRVGRDVLESSPADRPVLGLTVILPEDADGPSVKSPTKVDVRVYRFPSLEATLARMRPFIDAPNWTEATDPSVPTSGLPQVMSFSAALQTMPSSADHVIVFPTRLPRGWYLVDVGRATRRAQAFLQVTDVSAWVSVLSDQTVVWVNDVNRGRAIRDADVRVAGGPSIGRTGSNGLLVGRTPAELVPAASEASATTASPILIVRAPNGHALLVPFDTDRNGGTYRGEWSKGGPGQDNPWWSLLSTDRAVYRRDDRVEAWGFLRQRRDGTIPARVDLRLILAQNQDQADPAAVVRAVVQPRASGAYAASLQLSGVALGSYVLEAVVNGRVASRTWLDVGIVRKPAYRLSVEPARRAVITGDTVRTTIAASFFDDQPVPSTPFTVSDESETTSTTAPTGDDGRVTTDWKPTLAEEVEGSEWRTLSAIPARPEEGDINADATILVFPSSVNLAADGSITGKRLVVTGSLHEVDFARLERELAGTSSNYPDLDPNGQPVGGARVTATVAELIPVRHLVGYDYDSIAKRVVARYEYDVRRKPLRTLAATTQANASFRLSVRVPNADHGYEVVLTTVDGAGRTERRTIQASRSSVDQRSDLPIFESILGPRERDLDYRIGEPVKLTITDGTRPLPSGGSNRYLYVVSRQGLRSATVTSSPRFSRRFAADDAPAVFIIGVRFTGHTYAAKAATWANFDTRERRINVALSSDRSSYQPGDVATVSVQTTDERGQPIPSTVTLRAVDEKLFVMGNAQVIDPLGDLYLRVESGIVRLTATHQLPTGDGSEGEGGATGGGGGGGSEARDDFRDTLFFRQLETGPDGRATVTFQVSDDLTSWHVSASAVTSSLSAGEGQLMLSVGLPFFVEATIADEYLASDHPVIRVRAFGSALHAGDPVVFRVSSTSLGLATTDISGTAFKDVSVPLPPLSIGKQSITIGGQTTGQSGTPLADELVRSFSVVQSRLSAASVASATLTADLRPPGGPDITTYTFSDAGRGQFIALLQTLAADDGARVDQALARAIARDLLVTDFGYDPTTLPPATFDRAIYPVGQKDNDEGNLVAAGIPLVPYGGPDAALAAKIALIAPDRFDRSSLRDALWAVASLPTTTRELRLAILAGLAGLGEPVLADLRSASTATDLSIREQIDLALGFEAAGDDGAALAIERDLLAKQGQGLGSWTRLKVGRNLDDTVEATADLALVAAGIGDPVGRSLAAYVDANPAHDALHVLDQVGYVERALERTPSAAASFAYTVDGRRNVVDLADRTFSLAVTASQRDGLRLEPISGQVTLTASWNAPVDVAAVPVDAALQLSRTVDPAGTIPSDRLVVVDLTPTFGNQAVNGCYQVVDIVPSGLAPVARTDGWVGDDGTVGPYSIVGQRVEFCASNDPAAMRVTRMRYLARIVTPGEYAWEPAIMQLPDAPELAAFTPPVRVTIVAR